MEFSRVLIDWYLAKRRDLPWRTTRDPYRIWMSEIILQQTRVAQGLPYYYAFVEAFPTVFDLASADEQTVLKLWQGLGYYSRARNLHKTAKHVAEELNGLFPESYIELLKLNGVGAYTAAAIASFSYDEAVPVVDGNVYRVLSRYFDIETDIATPAARVEFTDLAAELLPKDKAALFNQAIMEFGALQCVPKNPVCEVCPFNTSCLALKLKKVCLLPIKSKKKPPRIRHLNYLLMRDDADNVAIQKRTGSGIWRNLYEFPLVETDSAVGIREMIHLINEVHEAAVVYESPEHDVIHKLTHQHLHIKFWNVRVKGQLQQAVAEADLQSYPFPIVLFNYIEKNWK